MRLEEKRFKEKRLSIVKYIFITRLNLSCVVSQGAWQGWKSLETFEHGATRLYNYGTQVKPPRCIVQSGDAVESCTRTRIHVPCIHEYTYAPESNSLSVTVGPSLSVPPLWLDVYSRTHMRVLALHRLRFSCVVHNIYARDIQCEADTRLE